MRNSFLSDGDDIGRDDVNYVVGSKALCFEMWNAGDHICLAGLRLAVWLSGCLAVWLSGCLCVGASENSARERSDASRLLAGIIFIN